MDTIFKAFQGRKILVVGDVMVDRYLMGRVSRISPEAPVPVVALEHYENRLGGAANVALNVQSLEAIPYLCSVSGQDEKAELLMSLLRQGGISGNYIIRSGTRRTTSKTRVIAQNQHLLRVDEEDTDDLTFEEEQALMKSVLKVLNTNDIDLILFQDYNKGVLSAGMIRNLLDEAQKRQIPTVVDPKKENFFAYRSATLFKPNLKEIRTSLPLAVDVSLDSLREAAAFLRRKMEVKYIFITLSERGLFVDDGRQSKLFPTQARNVADVCGAGDTVISVLAVALAAGMDIATMAELANLAGGQVCEQVGVVPVDLKQLKREYISLFIN